jgi:lipopolysaccharide/colanic/teichoic acid biosynthesis glycosyltransferase
MVGQLRGTDAGLMSVADAGPRQVWRTGTTCFPGAFSVPAGRTLRGARRLVAAGERVVSRGADALIAGLALLLLAIPLVAIAVWVRLDSPGPALFRQERVGLGGRPFTFLKFRSMYVGGDDYAHRKSIEAELRGERTAVDGSTKLSQDPRITRAGRFLRRTSLDELPQLINVLRGEMSLVGPRPCLAWEADLFPSMFADRFTVRPGITGLWQVSGRSTVGTLEMLHMDLLYVQHRRLRLDLWILLITIPSLLRGDGAR